MTDQGWTVPSAGSAFPFDAPGAWCKIKVEEFEPNLPCTDPKTGEPKHYKSGAPQLMHRIGGTVIESSDPAFPAGAAASFYMSGALKPTGEDANGPYGSKNAVISAAIKRATTLGGKAKVELASLKIDLEMDQHRLRSYDDERKKKDNEDAAHGVFTLEASVGLGVLTLASEIRRWARAHPSKPITLNIFSPGGSVFHGIQLYDTLRSLAGKGHVITTVVPSYAASMGSLLFLAGDVRIMGAEAQVMFHDLSAGTGGTLHEMEDDVKFYKRLNKRLRGIIVGRTKFTAAELDKKLLKFDLWLDAGEAKRFGVATNID